jgi:hypothetical protein
MEISPEARKQIAGASVVEALEIIFETAAIIQETTRGMRRTVAAEHVNAQAGIIKGICYGILAQYNAERALKKERSEED